MFPEIIIPPGWRLGFEAGSDVDTVAIEIVIVDDHVTKVNADAEDQPLCLRPLPQPGRGKVETHRRHALVDQTISEYGAAQAAQSHVRLTQTGPPTKVRKILDTTEHVV
jgi:hypothetical protein